MNTAEKRIPQQYSPEVAQKIEDSPTLKALFSMEAKLYNRGKLKDPQVMEHEGKKYTCMEDSVEIDMPDYRNDGKVRNYEFRICTPDNKYQYPYTIGPNWTVYIYGATGKTKITNDPALNETIINRLYSIT